MEYTFESSVFADNILHFKIKQNVTYLTFSEVFRLWNTSIDFRDFYINILQSCTYDAFFWEHPPLTLADLNYEYEFVLCESTYLDRRQVDTRSFAEYLQGEISVADFYNFGKNALLVVPTQKSDENNYRHLARFVRNAPPEQVRDVFEKIGQLITIEIERKGTIWLSTAGQGVIWLHVRMDIRPKYYKTAAYRNTIFWN